MESKAKNHFFAFYPEVQLMFSKAKDNANRVESKAKNHFFAFYPEVQLMFSKAKDNARVVERSEKNRVESKAKTDFLFSNV